MPVFLYRLNNANFHFQRHTKESGIEIQRKQGHFKFADLVKLTTYHIKLWLSLDENILSVQVFSRSLRNLLERIILHWQVEGLNELMTI